MKRRHRKAAEFVLCQLTPDEVSRLIRYVRSVRWSKLKRRLWTRRYRKEHGA